VRYAAADGAADADADGAVAVAAGAFEAVVGSDCHSGRW